MELISFVTMFFVSKRIALLTAFVCWPPAKTSLLWRSAGSAGLRVRGAPRGQLPADGASREGVLLDLDCPAAQAVLEQASSSRAFVLRYSWLLVAGGTLNVSDVAARLADVDVLPDADVTWSSPDAAVDVYKVKTGEPVIVTPCGLERTPDLREMEALWARRPTAVTRRKDMRDVSIKSATIITQPQHFKGWTDLTNRQIDTFPKLTYPLMMLLAEDLNFRYDMRQVSLYGEQRAGAFDGLAGLLQRGEVDVGVASVFMRADRTRVLHYSAETLELKGAFIFRQPARSAVCNVFALPFSRGVWAALVGALALAALMLAALGRRAGLAALTPLECFTFAVGAVCQQGWGLAPAAAWARGVQLSALVCALFAFTAYSAQIVSLLQSPAAAVRSLDQLARSPLALAVQDTTYRRVYFAESADPVTQQLYERKLRPQGERAYLSVVEGIARVRTGRVAFQVEQSAGYDVISRTFTEREKCGLQELEAFKLPAVAVPLRRHAGLRDLAATRLRWQREVGLMSRSRRVWLAARPCCAAAAGFRSVGLADVLPAVQLLAAGAALAAALLAAERAASALTRRWALPPRAAHVETHPLECRVET